MKHEDGTSISKQLTKSYMLLFPFFILSFLLVISLGTYISNQWVEETLPASRYPANRFIGPDIEAISVTEVVQSGGSAAAVDREGNVTVLGGTDMFETGHLSMDQWTAFLTKCSDPYGKYIYSVAYEEQGEFWLVVGFPVSVRMTLSFASNPQSQEYGKAVLFYGALGLALLLLLLLGTLLYARISSKPFITPLRQLCGMVKRMTRGNYEMEEVTSFHGEFLWLKNDISNLTVRLKEEKVLREKLEQDKRQMLLDISHDLRNPLATIMGSAETLCTDMTLEAEKQNRYAQIIWKSSIRANGLLGDLFTYSKLEHTGFRPSLIPGDICEFLREQLSQFIPDFEAAGIETEFLIPDTDIEIPFDSELLARAFSNLLTNTIRYSGAGTIFTFSLAAEEDRVHITAQDNGSGMEEAIAMTVFEPFNRGDRSRNSETGGSGLGLAIVKKVIQAHKGEIELITAPGKGCLFSVYLPKP